MDLEGLLRPMLERIGLELVEIAFGRDRGRSVLRVTVDREGGVDLDAIAAASERIGRRLDLEGFDPGPYELEVTSPGVERPLRERIDFARRIGERVRVRTATPVGGARNHRGRIVAAGENEVLIETESGERSLPYEAIASARTVFDWGNEVRAKGDGR